MLLPHSPLTLQLRTGVIECEYDLSIRLAYMQAFAAIHAHPQANLTAAFSEFGLLYGDARASIPYMTGGKGGKEQMSDDRMRFVDAFRKMRATEQAGYTPKTPGLKPKQLGKKKSK